MNQSSGSGNENSSSNNNPNNGSKIDEVEVEVFVRKQLKGTKMDDVLRAQYFCDAMIMQLQEAIKTDRSFSTKTKYSAYKLYRSNLAKRVIELKRRSVRNDLNRERYWTRRLMRERANPQHQQSVIQPRFEKEEIEYPIPHLPLEPQHIELAEKLASGVDIKDVRVYDDFSYDIIKTPDQIQRTPEEEEELRQYCDTLDTLLSKTEKEIELTSRNPVRPIIEGVKITPHQDQVVVKNNPQFDLTVENIQKALKDAGLFKN